MDNFDNEYADIIDVEEMEDFDFNKNYDMLCQLILDAGFNYIKKEGGLTKLVYYLDNLQKVDSLKSFIDDEMDGLLSAAFFLLKGDGTKVEAILRYIVDHENVNKFHEDNIIGAAGKSEYVFFKMVEAGGNIHYKSSNGFTTLHLAVEYSRNINVVRYLLDQNVDINCYNSFTSTPLHCACQRDNSDIIELLIQKGADVNLPNDDSLTPFELAIYYKQFNNVSLILNSKQTENVITFKLVKKLFSAFCELYSENSEEFKNNRFALPKPHGIIGYYNFFKLLYGKLIQYFTANNNATEPPVLLMYLNNNVFESKDWANALTVILTSEIATTLLEECLSYEKESIYALLIPKLIRAEVELEDRIKLLKLLLSLKMIPNLKDMALILTHYRFNEEFQLLNLYLPDDCLLNGYNQNNPMEYIASVFCGLENDLDYNKIFGEELPETFYDFIKQYFTPALSNCSSNAYYRNSEMNLPNILSLQELSRNSARKLIKKNKILSPRDFISAVHSLPIPTKCKNYISLNIKVDEL